MNAAEADAQRLQENLQVVASLRARFKSLAIEGHELRVFLNDGKPLGLNWEGTFKQACKDAWWKAHREELHIDGIDIPERWFSAAELVAADLRSRVEQKRKNDHCAEHGHATRVTSRSPRGRIVSTCSCCGISRVTWSLST